MVQAWQDLNPTGYGIYLAPPDGIELRNGNVALHLRKALYGLKQSGRVNLD